VPIGRRTRSQAAVGEAGGPRPLGAPAPGAGSSGAGAPASPAPPAAAKPAAGKQRQPDMQSPPGAGQPSPLLRGAKRSKQATAAEAQLLPASAGTQVPGSHPEAPAARLRDVLLQRCGKDDDAVPPVEEQQAEDPPAPRPRKPRAAAAATWGADEDQALRLVRCGCSCCYSCFLSPPGEMGGGGGVSAHSRLQCRHRSKGACHPSPCTPLLSRASRMHHRHPRAAASTLLSRVDRTARACTPPPRRQPGQHVRPPAVPVPRLPAG
jgi:hypothetical protein